MEDRQWRELARSRRPAHIGRPEKSSRYIGVTFREDKGGKWAARLTLKGKNLHLGLYENEVDAARAYNAVVIERGLNKPLNQIDELEVCTNLRKEELTCHTNQQADQRVGTLSNLE
jgi:hypothetical protein